jgi:hypothetical protein
LRCPWERERKLERERDGKEGRDREKAHGRGEISVFYQSTKTVLSLETVILKWSL